MEYLFDKSDGITHRIPDEDELELEPAERLRPWPGKSSRTHGRGNGPAAPGRVSLTALLAERLAETGDAGPAEPVRLDRKASAPAQPGPAAREALAEALGASGMPLPDEVRRSLELVAGEDLASVRVHVDQSADRAARAVHALAFTVGQDIHFAAGQYQPESARGRELIAHEVAHAIQQRSSSAPGPGSLRISEPGDASEREADAFARRFASSAPPAVAETGPRMPRMRAETGPAWIARTGGPDSDPVDVEQIITDAGLSAWPTLASYVRAALQADAALAESYATADLSSEATRKELIALGRRGWRGAAGAAAFVSAAATELGDATAQTKISQVQSETDYDPAVNGPALVAGFFDEVATRLTNAASTDAVWKDQIYSDASTSPMTAVAGQAAYLMKGRPVDYAAHSKVMLRTMGLRAFWQYNAVPARRDHWLAELRELFPVSASLSLELDGGDFSAFELWALHCATEEMVRQDAFNMLDRTKALSSGTGTTWWSNEGVVLEPVADPKLMSAGYTNTIDLLALKDSWYPEGLIRLRVDPTVLESISYELRKPTAFDGMLSSLYEPLPGGEWGETAGGAPELVGPSLSAEYVQADDTGVEPMVADAVGLYSKLKALVDAHGTLAAKDEYANGPVAIKIKLNPIIEVLAPSVDGGRVSISNPPVAHPGLTVQTVDLQLADAGRGPVESGSLTVDIDAAGAVQKTGAVLPVDPTPVDGADAHVQNDIRDAQSSLDQLLGRLNASARLIDGGVEGTLSVDPGPSGIPGFDIQQCAVTVRFVDGAVTAEGTLALAHTSGSLTVSATLGWDGGWYATGEAQVSEVIDGLEPFTVSFDHRGGVTQIRAEQVAFARTIGSVSLTGTAQEILYDATAGAFSGTVALDADLGAFGQAGGYASIADNQLAQATLTYKTPELRYPADSETPIIAGTVGGTLTFAEGALSGQIDGSATIRPPGLESLMGEGNQSLGLAVNVTVNPDGSFGGTIASTSAIALGEYFRIPELSATLEPGGALSSQFAVEVVNLPFLEQGRMDCKIDESGFQVISVQAEIPFGDEENGRVWGSIGADYNATDGFRVHGNAHVRIKDDMVAHGDFAYTTTTGEVDAQLSVDDITLFDYGPTTHQLFHLESNLILFSVPPAAGLLGAYLDLGLNLGFSYRLQLTLSPSVTLEGLALDDFSFTKAAATVGLGGEIVATLQGTPNIGLGLYAIHPKLLRGGGGIAVPIVAEARLTPSGNVSADYTPEGGISGSAKVGMGLTFGITGSVTPYAELALLDGAIEKDWTGDSVADFEILPPRELFTYVLDLGGDLGQDQAPTIPASLGEPQAITADQTLAQDTGTASTPALPTGQRGQDAATAEPAEGESGAESGFDFLGLIGQLLGQPNLAAVREVLDVAAETWESIAEFVTSVAGVLKNWMSNLSQGVTEILRGFAEHGFVGYAAILVRSVVGDEIYYLIEPIFTELDVLEDKLEVLAGRALPTTAEEFFDWGLEMIAGVMNIGFSGITAAAGAIAAIWSRLQSHGASLVNQLIRQGDLGVKRHPYSVTLPDPTWTNPFRTRDHWFLAATEYKIHVLGYSEHHVQEDIMDAIASLDPRRIWDAITDLPGSAVGVALWNALEAVDEIPPTNNERHSRSGKTYADYWVD